MMHKSHGSFVQTIHIFLGSLSEVFFKFPKMTINYLPVFASRFRLRPYGFRLRPYGASKRKQPRHAKAIRRRRLDSKNNFDVAINHFA